MTYELNSDFIFEVFCLCRNAVALVLKIRTDVQRFLTNKVTTLIFYCHNIPVHIGLCQHSVVCNIYRWMMKRNKRDPAYRSKRIILALWGEMNHCEGNSRNVFRCWTRCLIILNIEKGSRWYIEFNYKHN